MADVGDQQPSQDAPTTPFRKIVVPAEETAGPADETVWISRPPTPRPSGPQPTPPYGPQPRSGPQAGSSYGQQPRSGPQGASPHGAQAQSGPQPSSPYGTQPRSGPQGASPYGAQPRSGPQGASPYGPQPRSGPQAGSSYGSGPQAGTWAGAATRVGAGPGASPQQQYPLPPTLPPAPPRTGLVSRIGDIPIRVVYLLGAIIATVVAVVLIFILFSGDVPKNQQPQGGSIPPPPASEPTAAGSAAPSKVAPSRTAQSKAAAPLPSVPAAKEYAVLPGTASVVIGLVDDQKTGLSYPRLGSPWKTATVAPFTVAQRAGKATAPGTPGALIGSAPLPGAAPATPPSKESDYRKLAARAAQWALGAQYPPGATLTWTGSERAALGKGWTLAFEVAYETDGGRRVAQGLVSVVNAGRAKPAMLFASIPESGKSRWRDLNTLADRIAPA
ncbi:hypothetical protein [Nonomuraea roseoviolacea]|uniref:Uncharacterized protein n=1 Tax=Nonomuraea roseoviolacea subsp. carminata TaxID=160689 RepID=A0ABT1JWM7_9ACTN|nr:hypothetical protein [Nonomuraea roseoviolacea]MCP2345759.1 hypothetical protein [Nonomuraea roseoviolacea subsp. carminata]